MSDAQAMGHIKSDPTLKVRIPQKKENKIKKPYVTAEQVGIFLEEVKGHRLEVPFLFGLYFGLRREEICGIRWSAIRDNRLFIEHTVVRLKTRVAKDRTKTESSARDYPLSPEMIDLLKKIRDKQDINRRYFGNTYVESDYVFTWEDGRPYDPDYLTRGFKKLVKGSDRLDDALTLHSLRASCVSLLIHAGVDIKSIQDWTGHKDVQTMLGVYARMSEKDKSLVENRMNSLVFGDSGEGQESRTGDYENRDS